VKNFQRILIMGCSLVALAGCGADEIVSPGTGGNINIDITNPAPTPTPTPTGGTGVQPAADCPDIFSTGGLANQGTISGPTGTYRVCRLPSTIDRSDTLPFIRGVVYNIGGQVFVGADSGFDGTQNAGSTGVVLTVEPGVILYGQGQQALIVRRGNRLVSNGTADRPIVWTSRDNIEGIAGNEAQQQWGGVVLLGRGRVSDCSNGVENLDTNFTQNPTCQQNLEGAAVSIPYGGNNNNDSSGSFTFNQIRFSGFELAPGNELQSLTTGGAGGGTTISNLMSFNSSDDGVEFFGGQLNVRNLAIIGASDDSLDVDTGAQVNVDTMIAVQRASTGDSLIEYDSNNQRSPNFTPITARPITRLQVNNFTFVARSVSLATGNGAVIRARGGAALGLTNGVIDRLDGDNSFCFRVDEDETLANLIGIDSVVCDGGTDRQARGDRGANANSTTDTEVLTAITAGSGVSLNFAITLTGTVINGANETAHPVINANTRSSFFPTRTYIGAVQNAAGLATFRNWTCNSPTFDFGSSTGACTSLPVYS
jgi:hypothetical protein